MKILVTGSRDWTDSYTVMKALQTFYQPGMTVIEGGSSGADAYARGWAVRANGVVLETHHAEWHLHGRRAGPLRNRKMLHLLNPDYDIVLAFILNGSHGATGTVAMAEREFGFTRNLNMFVTEYRVPDFAYAARRRQ